MQTTDPNEDPDGDAYDAYLDAMERGEAPPPVTFLKRWPGASADLALRLERLYTEFGSRNPLPDHIGPFRIIGRLGRGGMGEVFRGVDPGLDREVAIKVLGQSGRLTQERIDRLAREARTLAALDHRSIAAIHSFGTSDTLGPFFVMELVPGEDLGKLLIREPFEWRTALRISVEVADALGTAHARGIVHRDLKPSNVMLRPDGSIKVLDFGLAASPGETVRASDGSSVHGTPGYMSPEQARGKPHSATDDIWAAGCLTHECLTGRRLERVEAGVPIVRDKPADVPLALWRVVEQCLREDARARYPDGAALHAALHSLGERLGSAGEVPVTIPEARTRFLGRMSVRAELNAALGASRLVTVTGPGGVGKSRLAREVILAAGRVTWVDLAPGDESDIESATLAALGVRQITDESSAADVARVLSDLGEITLVFDNCEHVLPRIANWIEEILHTAPSARILATSRVALGLAGERVVTLEPLLRAEARGLFEDRARAAGTKGLGLETRDAVDAICRAIDNLPLAIELAAARAPQIGLDELLRSLEHSSALLQSRDHTRHERHQNLTALVDWSLARLTHLQRATFRRLAVFSDGWTLPSAEAVVTCADRPEVHRTHVLPAVADLTEHSLVLRDHTRGRWRFLETLRHAAVDELHASGEEELCRRALAIRILDVAEHAIDAGLGVGRAGAFLALENELSDFDSAMSWSLGCEEFAHRAYRVAGGLYEFCISRGRLRDGLRIARQAHDAGLDVSPSERASMLLSLGTYEQRLGDYRAAKTWLEESLALARTTHDDQLIARVERNLGFRAVHAGEFETARNYLESSRSLEVELGDDRRVGNIHNDLGILAIYEGRVADAVREYEEGLRLRTRAGDQWGIASSLGNLGEAHQRAGEFGRARNELSRSLQLFWELGDLRSVAESFEMSASLEAATGATERGALLSGAAAAMRAQYGFPKPKAESASYERDQVQLKERLGETLYAEKVAEGAALSVDEAIDVALSGD